MWTTRRENVGSKGYCGALRQPGGAIVGLVEDGGTSSINKVKKNLPQIPYLFLSTIARKILQKNITLT